MNGRYYIRFNQVKELIENYPYPEPFSVYLKKYFSSNKKLGGKDRKQLKHWFYAYFKSDYINEQLSIEEELNQVLYADDSEILSNLNDDQNARQLIAIEPYFPLVKRLSNKIEKEGLISNLKQEKPIWIRLKTSHQELENLAIDKHEKLIALPTNTNIQLASALYQIQDLASYKAAMLCLENIKGCVWETCSGAGGKALCILDKNPNISYYASDIRANILENLHQRLDGKYIKTTVLDLTKSHQKINFQGEQVGHQYFDNIIADVPCSGSGTWGRNPQHLRYFDELKLKNYTNLQRKIIENALPFLINGGKLFYLTCSVYKDENEEQVSYFAKEFGLKLKEEAYFGQSNSDYLYWAMLEKL